MTKWSQSAASGWSRLLGVLAVLALAGAGFGAFRWLSATPKIPTAEVKVGEFTDYLELRGQLKAIRSITVNAPADAEDLQILHLIRDGSRVKKGDVLVQFDVTKLKAELAQDRSALKAAEAESIRTKAQSRLTTEQDRTDVLKDGYDVESAKLDASKGEIVSKIEGAEAGLQVDNTQSILAAAQQKSNSDQAGAAADLQGKLDKIAKARYDVQQAEHRIAVLTLRAPIDGIITVLPNFRAGGFSGGAQAFKEGDSAWPGAAILEIPDLSTLRVAARVDETDRARIALGQTAAVRVDAVPDREFHGRVATISTLATVDFSGGWPFPKNFELSVGLDDLDARLRPGMNATARIAVEKIAGAVLIPTEAAFQKSGETVAYVLHGSRFEARTIQVSKRGESQLVVASGLRPGELVALRDPDEKADS
jgi:HlyD family secretion protein